MAEFKPLSHQQWCLVGNVVDEHPICEGSTQTHRGTKHFSPGTKVYCLPAQWGDGYRKIVVIGRHRGSKQFTTVVMHSQSIENWRVMAVYNPEVIRRLRVATSETWQPLWTSKAEVEAFVAMLEKRKASI